MERNMNLGFTPTQEQQGIVNAALRGENITIQAYAGASKTTTLLLTSYELVKPSLYMAYNKAMAEEAKEKFPSHVEVRTSHSLAYAHVGNQYRHKLQRPRGAYKNLCGTGGEIGRYYKIKAIELSNDKFISSAAIGLCIRDTVNHFEHSADKRITEDHIPKHLINDFKKRKGFVEVTFKQTVLEYAKKLWKEREDLDSPILCTHDTYMKLFQLSKPKLSGYEVIYLDEAADTNLCLLDIFLNQDCQKILVGDNYQSIYQWRGSVNAMSMTNYKEYSLTQSFRFGQPIADLATLILRDKKTGDLNAQVKGFDKVISSVNESTNNIEYPYTILYRTNAVLLAEAVQLIKEGVKLNIETDMGDFVKLLTSAVALYTGDIKSVKHESIVPFNSWDELKIETKSNPELTRVAKIISDGDALEYIRVLETHYNVTNPDVTLTTAHKSKGREWDTVVLADDFPSNYDAKGKFIGLETQERNLVYVAATRAKHKLYYNETVEEFMSLGSGNGLSINVKGICEVGDYNIHKLPAFIDNNIGEHALDAVLRGIDELEMLESFERGEISSEDAYDMGIIDEAGASLYSGDIYDNSIGKQIDDHITYMPTLKVGKRKKK
jgi:superfamily I DNA/RNA helicase